MIKVGDKVMYNGIVADVVHVNDKKDWIGNKYLIKYVSSCRGFGGKVRLVKEDDVEKIQDKREEEVGIKVGDKVIYNDDCRDAGIEAEVTYIDEKGNWLGCTHLIKYIDPLDGDFTTRLVCEGDLEKV